MTVSKIDNAFSVSGRAPHHPETLDIGHPKAFLIDNNRKSIFNFLCHRKTPIEEEKVLQLPVLLSRALAVVRR